MKAEELFPPCTLEPCPFDAKLTGTKHHHILPQQQEVLDSTERMIALVGGYGSAKTLPLCVLGHLLSVSIPGNIGLVCRRSLPKLNGSTKRIFLEVLQRSGIGFVPREMRDGLPGKIIYENGSEVEFRETKDIGRFLGPEYGWFLIDEAQEEPEATFKFLVGRLRLPRARKYLKGMMATNPPRKTHWLARRFPKPGSHATEVEVRKRKVRVTYRMIRSSTYDNPFAPDEYIATILDTNSTQEAKRVLEGGYSYTQEGVPVFSQFLNNKHVGDIPIRLMTLYRVWDFGYNLPACTWHQMFRCRYNTLHWVTLREHHGEQIEAHDFGVEVLKFTKDNFPDIPERFIVDGGDTAGAQHTDKGPGPIIRLSRPINKENPSEGGLGLRFKHRKFPNIDPGLDLIRKCMKTTCKCGFPLYMIDRSCDDTIEGLGGGYHYPKEKPGMDLNKDAKPVKDGFYDNFIDTVRYAGELFYRPLSTNEDEDIMELLKREGLQTDEKPSWAWMERN